MSSAALAMSTTNRVQIANLNQEVKTVTETIKTLQKTKYTQDAQILQLTDGQFKLAVELNSTQQAINRTMYLVNQHTDILRDHDEAIRKIGEFSTFINNKLNAFMHNVEGHFLHTSIEGILRGNLNLHFIHHDDIPKAIKYIIRSTNISFEDNNSSISMIDLVTRLLVRQEISFIPTIQLRTFTYGAIIGVLVFTSYFAASNYHEKPFFL
jgi:isocitrate dehydrogenase kinase/phosphatase